MDFQHGGNVDKELTRKAGIARNFVARVLKNAEWERSQSMPFVFGTRKKTWPSCTLQVENVVSFVHAFQGAQGLKLVNAKIYDMLPDADWCMKGGGATVTLKMFCYISTRTLCHRLLGGRAEVSGGGLGAFAPSG